MLKNTQDVSQRELHHEKLCGLSFLRDAGVGKGQERKDTSKIYIS